MPQRSLIASLGFVSLAVGASCFNEAKAPAIVPTRTLGLPVESALSGPIGPVSVAFSSSSPVGVVFDRPMRSGAAVLRGAGGGQTAGEWRWVGQSALVFSPSSRLPLATEYEVTVAAGGQGMDGSVLSAPYAFRFATERPAVVSLEPREGQISLNPTFDVLFNQPVSPDEAERAARLWVGDDKDKKAVLLRAHRPDAGADTRTRLVLVPVATLPPGSSAELVLDESLRGLEGPLASGRSERFAMRTRGALGVVSVRRTLARARSKCASAGVELEVSNPVTVRELQAHVRFEPPAPIAWNREDDDALTKVDLRASLAPARKYQLVVTSGMKDVYGQALAKTTSSLLEAGSEPLLQIGEQEVFAAGGPRGSARTIGVEAANLSAYDLLALPLNEVSLARYFAEATPGAPDPLAEASRLFPQAKIQAVRLASPLGAQETRALSLDALLAGERGVGAALVVAETEGPTRAGTQLGAVRVVTQTDLRMTARIALRGGVVWVERLSNGKPVPGAVVALRDATGSEVATARADESGMAILPPDARALVSDGGSVDPRSLLVARSGDDWTFRPVADDLEAACREPATGLARFTGALITDHESYELGDTIQLKALFREERRQGEVAPAGRPVRLTLTGPHGNLASTTEGKLDSYGGFAARIGIPATEREGPWVLRAEVLLDVDHGAGAATAGVRVVAPTRVAGDDPPRAAGVSAARPPRAVEPAAPSRPAAASSARLTLAADRDLYEIGQTATLRFGSPFREADAFVSVEGMGAPHGERVHVVGPTPTLRVPITEDMSPNAHVAVLLSKTPGAAASSDESTALAVGQLDLRVQGSPRRLRVAISPATQNPAPGGALEVDIAVTDQAGRPLRASVAFFAVEGGAARPDPLRVFDAPPGSGAYWVESREDMGRTLLPARGTQPKAAPDLVAETSVERVGRTAFFDGALLTEVTGRAHVRFTVPPHCASLHLFAVAATVDSRFGGGDASVDTSPPLGLELEGPAIVRAGDQFEVRATIGSRDAGPGPHPVDLTMAAIGVDAGPNVKRTVMVPAGARVETRWPVRATEVGKADIVFTARANDQVTEATFERRVEDPSELEDVVLYGDTADAAAEHLGDWPNIRPDDGALDLKVSATALVGLDDGIEQILRYPYEDAEQHATRLVALVALPDLIKDFGVVLPSDGGVLVDREIATLLGAQQADGSFTAWQDAGERPESAAWRSAYALWALNAAAVHDHKVPEDATSRAVAFVKQSLATWDRSPHETAEAALALDVLTDLGLGDGERMLALYQARGRQPLFVRALLAHAMTVQQMDDSKVEDLLGDLDSHLRTTAEGSIVVGEEREAAEYGPLHDSSARATAMVLRALVARAKARATNVFRKIRPSDLAARVARGLLSLRRGGAWRTPEETAWALRALEDYRAAHVLNHPDVDALFYLNGVELIKLPLHDRKAWQVAATFGMRKVLGAAAPGGTLGFRVNGDATLHYEARLRYARAELGAQVVDRGLAVDKRMEPIDAGPLAGDGPRVVKRGDRVAVDILVATPVARDEVMIDDPLPGGMVALGDGVAGGGRSLGLASHFEIKDGRVVLYVGHLPAGLSSFRYMARAVASGRYLVPATRASCRYAPEVLGRTKAAEVEVRE